MHHNTEEQEIINLVLALIGERWRALYDRSATFNTNINALARMLPLWIDAIAASSMGIERKMVDEMLRLPTSSWPGVLPPPSLDELRETKD